MSGQTPAERKLFGRLGAYTMLSRHDPLEITKAAREVSVRGSSATLTRMAYFRSKSAYVARRWPERHKSPDWR